uniref:Uncharacterized protein n=1 Tax=uncultured marine virus TaxID=186617 RepID=A0A0F7L6E6_9VIRU|nr:hypothetical protein [uncultured marine virus]
MVGLPASFGDGRGHHVQHPPHADIAPGHRRIQVPKGDVSLCIRRRRVVGHSIGGWAIDPCASAVGRVRGRPVLASEGACPEREPELNGAGHVHAHRADGRGTVDVEYPELCQREPDHHLIVIRAVGVENPKGHRRG